MEIKVYGPGCKRCQAAEKVVREAVAELGRQITVTKISDISEIAAAGIMATPAVTIDGALKSTGQVPTKAEVKSWFGA